MLRILVAAGVTAFQRRYFFPETLQFRKKLGMSRRRAAACSQACCLIADSRRSRLSLTERLSSPFLDVHSSLNGSYQCRPRYRAPKNCGACASGKTFPAPSFQQPAKHSFGLSAFDVSGAAKAALQRLGCASDFDNTYNTMKSTCTKITRFNH